MAGLAPPPPPPPPQALSDEELAQLGKSMQRVGSGWLAAAADRERETERVDLYGVAKTIAAPPR